MAASLPDEMNEDARDTLLAGVVARNMLLFNLSLFTFASPKEQDPEHISVKEYQYQINSMSPSGGR